MLTKADKLNKTEAAKALSIARLQAGGGEVKLFSALKKQGVTEVAELLWQWTHTATAAGSVAQQQVTAADTETEADGDTDLDPSTSSETSGS